MAPNIEQLRSLIQEAEEIAADQVVFIPLYALPRWELWSTDFAASGRDLGTLRNAEHWYLTDP